MRRALLRGPLAAASVLALCAAGCSTLPHNTDPQVIGTFEEHSTDEDPVIGPEDGREPDLLLRDFFTAAAIPVGDYEAARKFLDPRIRDSWEPTGNVLILDSIDLNTVSRPDADTIDYSVHGKIIGSLSSGGSYSPENTGYDARLTMRKVDGQWRISDLPAGVVIERNELRNRYQPYSLYFYNQSGKSLVSDRRWLYNGQDSLLAELVTLLIEGPTEDLEPATSSFVPQEATFVGVEDGALRFSGMTGMDQEERTKFAAQLVWTLNNAGLGQEFRVRADGSPLIESFEAIAPDDFAEYNPQEAAESVADVYALYEGSILRVTSEGPTPAGGAADAGTVQSADISGERILAAVVRDGEDYYSLAMGELGGNAQRRLHAKTLARPTFEENGQAVWTVEDGKRLVRVVRSATTGEITDAEIDSSELNPFGGEISVIRLSHTGARAALIIDGAVYTGVVTRTTAGKYRLINIRELAPELSGTALSLDWQTDGALLVGTSSANSPVWRVEQDGSATSAISAGNISAPVVAVATSPSTFYVTDSRAMLELPAFNADNTYWREVPGMQGKRSSPIIAN